MRQRTATTSPERTCIACRQRRPATELDRYVAVEGTVVAGRSLPGRGAWVCRNTGCLSAAVDKALFGRALRVTTTLEPPDGSPSPARRP